MVTENFPFILRVVYPLTRFVPNVKKSDRDVSFKEKCLWTSATLIVYLVCCQVPLYGIIRSTTSDPFYWFRVIVASNRGTLMELGITPIVTSSMMVQLLVSSNLIKVDMQNKSQREVFISLQKLLAIGSILFQAFVLVRSGMYGSFAQLGSGNVMLIFFQLSAAGTLVLLLDEMLEGGFGLGSGISLFIATNFSETLFWKTFSPTTINTVKGMQFEGALVELIYSFASKRPSFWGFVSMLNRQNLPNLREIVGIFLLSTAVVYLSAFHYDLPLAKKGVRGTYGSFPVKLLSSSNVPIILQSTITSNVLSVSRVLFNLYEHHPAIRYLGGWEYVDGYFVPVSGLCYYIYPVTSFAEIKEDPAHFVFYVVSVIAMCGLFSLAWLDVSGSSPRKIARNLDSKGLVIEGKSRRHTFPIIQSYVTTSAVLGGMFIGALTILADFVGWVGSGTGLMLSASLIHNYFELYKNNKRSAF